jgi:hypothetical protein
MDAGTSPARQTRTKHRHELRTLTYVTLDQANGGIVRNLSRDGIGVQAVAAIRPLQEVRIRFELRYPKLQVEARGQVMWSTFSGQCGIRFLDLPPRTTRQVQEWIFGNLLEGVALHADRGIFAAPAPGEGATAVAQAWAPEDDGLLVSPTPLNIIELPCYPEPVSRSRAESIVSGRGASPLDWLLQPLSESGLCWIANTLVVLAGLLLFALVFLSVTHEAPTWRVVLAAAAVVPAIYWGFFQIFGGCSLGSRLARLLGNELDEEEPSGARFR